MKKDKIWKKDLIFIAEIGGNHGGNLSLAKKMVAAAKRSGADIAKFQTYKVSQFIRLTCKYYEELEVETLSDNEWKGLKQYCDKIGIVFLSTPFDVESLALLRKLKVSGFKIASGDITAKPLLKAVARTKQPILLSTGASTMKEVGEAIKILRKNGSRLVKLLHCVCAYPATPSDYNLRSMISMKKSFRVGMGISDHTPGIAVALAAIALGAEVVEKHFTIDRQLPGGDNAISILPEEMNQLIDLGKKIKSSIGSDKKAIIGCERTVRNQIRRSIVASRAIKKGEIFTKTNLCFKRPATGLSPMKIDIIIGKKAKRDFKKDQNIII